MLLELQSFPILLHRKNTTDNSEMYLENINSMSKKPEVDEEQEENKKPEEDDEELEEDDEELEEDDEELEEDDEELEEDDEELEEDDEELEEDDDEPISKSNKRNTAKKNSNSIEFKDIDLTPINKSLDKSFKEI